MKIVDMSYDEMINILDTNKLFTPGKVQPFLLRTNGYNHFGSAVNLNSKTRGKKRTQVDERDIDFLKLYKKFCCKKYKFVYLKENILPEIKHLYPLYDDELLGLEDNESYVIRMVNKKLKANKDKRRLFEFKINLNPRLFNYFVTITYDGKIFLSEQDFKDTVTKKLHNLATREGWRFACCFERGTEPGDGGTDGRLHIHGFFYIPRNKMKGCLRKQMLYSRKKHGVSRIHHNTFFNNIGYTDFQKIDLTYPADYKRVKQYCVKYIEKQDCEMLYSRHIASFMVVMCDTVKDVFCVNQYMTGSLSCLMCSKNYDVRNNIKVTCLNKKNRIKTIIDLIRRSKPLEETNMFLA